MSAVDPDNNNPPANLAQADEPLLDAAVEELSESKVTAPSAQKEAALFDKGQTPEEARDHAEIEGLSEGTRQTKRVNWARLIVLGSLFFLIVLWIVSVILLTAALGFHWRGFSLPDMVMITYITTTTASVFGLFLIAAKWLFPAKSDD